MNAREYLDEKYKHKIKDCKNTNTIFDTNSYFRIDDMPELMEEYHTLKSQEEAEERYRKALSYYDNETYMNGKSTSAVVNAIRIASGKEQSK